MTLAEVRAKFVDLSGMNNLVKGSGADNGANFLINAAQRYLDGRQDSPKSLAWYKEDVAVDGYKISFTKTRSIREVWITNADGRAELVKKPLKWMKENYAKVISELDTGTPLYYSPIVMGLSPDQDDLTAENYTDEFTYDFQEIMFGSHYAYDGILFLPPAGETYTVSVLGKFYSKEMTSDTDKTFWTERFPEILIQATYLMVEEFHRNSEGVNDWEAVITRHLRGVDFDMADQESVNQMNG